MNKPYAESSEQNREPIIAVLKTVFGNAHRVLEIGSGTGQHAAYFAPELPHLDWQPSDVVENLAGIQAWVDEAALPNIRPPVALNVDSDPWPLGVYDGIFTANTLHIMHWETVVNCVQGVAKAMPTAGQFAAYGPFNYGGEFTAPSNASFDAWLKQRDPGSGVRNFEDLNALAEDCGLMLVDDIEMPANNRILVWQKI